MPWAGWGTGSSTRMTRFGIEARTRTRSIARGLELAIQDGRQPQADQDGLRVAAQMDLHPPAGELLNPFHPSQVYDRTTVNPDELLARKL